MAKLASALDATIAGTQLRGKLDFFSRFAFSRNIVCERTRISANIVQARSPLHT